MSNFRKCPVCGKKVYKYSTHCYNCNNEIDIKECNRIDKEQNKLYLRVIIICVSVIALFWLVVGSFELLDRIIHLVCSKLNELLVPLKYPKV